MFVKFVIVTGEAEEITQFLGIVWSGLANLPNIQQSLYVGLFELVQN